MNIVDHAWGVKVITMLTHIDKRGYFSEVFTDHVELAVGTRFVGDNTSYSAEGVIRGFHSQIPGQAKLVRCIQGRIIDVIVNRETKEFIHFELSNPTQWVFIPPHLYHGFLALEDSQVHYKVNTKFNHHGQLALAWNSPSLLIPWHRWLGNRKWIISDKDLEAEKI